MTLIFCLSIKNVSGSLVIMICGYWESHLLTRSWRRSLSYRIKSIDLQSTTMDLFLYDRDLRHEWVNGNLELFKNSETLVTYSRACDSVNKYFVIFRRQFSLVSSNFDIHGVYMQVKEGNIHRQQCKRANFKTGVKENKARQIFRRTNIC